MLYINGDFGSPNTDSQGYSPRVPAERNVNAKGANPSTPRPQPLHPLPGHQGPTSPRSRLQPVQPGSDEAISADFK